MQEMRKGGRAPHGSVTQRGLMQWQARIRIRGKRRIETFETGRKAVSWLEGPIKAKFLLRKKTGADARRGYSVGTLCTHGDAMSDGELAAAIASTAGAGMVIGSALP